MEVQNFKGIALEVGLLMRLKILGIWSYQAVICCLK